MISAPPFLAWPDRTVLSHFIRRGIEIGILWVVVYGGADLITGWRTTRFRVHFDWELAIPFVFLKIRHGQVGPQDFRKSLRFDLRLRR